MRFLKYFLASSALAGALVGCSSDDGKTQSLALSQCHIPGIQDLSSCGFLEVPENWSKPNGIKIKIHIARIPPSGGVAQGPPLFILAGGPGEAASSYGSLISSALSKARRGRELILVDQRGTGKSAPFLCSWDGLSANATGADLARRCEVDKDRNLRFYNSLAFIKDLDATRQALGFEKIDIWAGSYGTRAALVYGREYSKNVGVMVLDSVAPPTIHLLEKDSATFGRAFEQTLSACESDPDCSRAFPKLRMTFAKLRSLLRLNPAKLATAENSITVDDNVFVTGLESYLYQPSFAASIPYIISEAAGGNFKPWQALSSNDTYGSLSPALTLSVQCAEEAPRTKVSDTGKSLFQSNYTGLFKEACSDWPVEDRSAVLAKPLSANIPTLLLAGAIDPVTPPDFAKEAARTLPQAQLLIAPSAGHAVSPFGCAPALIAQFLDQRGQNRIDGKCLFQTKRPPFILSANGPKF